MARIIKVTWRQLMEALESDFSYLDDEDDYDGYNGDTEVSVVSNKSDGSPSKPVDTDGFANTMSPGWYYGNRGPRGRYVMACSKGQEEDEALNEENSQLKDRNFTIPDWLYMKLSSVLKKHAGDTTTPGYKRLNNLLADRNVSYSDMKRVKNYFDNYQGDGTDAEYEMNGGKDMRDWVDSALKTARDAVYNVKDAKRNAGMQNAFIRPHEKDFRNKNAGKPAMPKAGQPTGGMEEGGSVKSENRKPVVVRCTMGQLAEALKNSGKII